MVLGKLMDHGDVDLLAELAALRAMVQQTDARVAALSTQQTELVHSIDNLSASVDKLSNSMTDVKSGVKNNAHEVEELRAGLKDVATTMGAAVINVHTDFARVLHAVGPAFEQVQKTVVPFASAVSGLTGEVGQHQMNNGERHWT